MTEYYIFKNILIKNLNRGNIILFNHNSNDIRYYNYNHSILYVGNNLKNRIDLLFNNKFEIIGINNEDYYFCSFDKNNNFLFITIDQIITKFNRNIKIFGILIPDLFSLGIYENYIIQEKLINEIILNYYTKKLNIANHIKSKNYCFKMYLQTIEKLLDVKFKTYFTFYGDFSFFNFKIFFEKKILI